MARVLEVLALAEDIRGDQHAQFVGRGDLFAGLPLLIGAEAPGERRRVVRVAGDGGHLARRRAARAAPRGRRRCRRTG